MIPAPVPPAGVSLAFERAAANFIRAQHVAFKRKLSGALTEHPKAIAAFAASSAIVASSPTQAKITSGNIMNQAALAVSKIRAIV